MKKLFPLLVFCGLLHLQSCKKGISHSQEIKPVQQAVLPNDVIPFMDEWKILLGDGTSIKKDLSHYENKEFFYATQQEGTHWVVYKTPNSGITSKTSSNTRTELGQINRWTPKTGGNLTGTLKVQHVSTNGDARVAGGFTVVVGQIHSDDGHKNEPLKICYKKFPGHEKGAVFWNYEINTEDSNSGRWDHSTTVWGYNMSYVGDTSNSDPEEPEDGIALGEEFSYEINVYEGVMYLTFMSEGHPTKTFTKSLIESSFTTAADKPEELSLIHI